MRTAVIAGLVVFAGLTTSAAAMRAGGAAAVATPHTAGATPAALTVSLHLELRCAKPGPAAIAISLPRAWWVPKAIARKAVWIDKSHPDAVSVSHHNLTLQPKTPTGTCTVIAPGTIKVRFTRAAAKLGNPRTAGRYTVRASIGTKEFR
ncbi:MAG TPA: hypothetical protein VKT80_18110, partial [Chloroflexota bacterium]|nr:hypothetical protein [Chloroflexota bacterium]